MRKLTLTFALTILFAAIVIGFVILLNGGTLSPVTRAQAKTIRVEPAIHVISAVESADCVSVSASSDTTTQSCPSGYRKCGSGRDISCCGPREVCCRGKYGYYCSDGRCPN